MLFLSSLLYFLVFIFLLFHLFFRHKPTKEVITAYGINRKKIRGAIKSKLRPDSLPPNSKIREAITKVTIRSGAETKRNQRVGNLFTTKIAIIGENSATKMNIR